jgi:2-dehydropantoate 2-reductase
MKLAIVGAGATGGFLGGMLARAGEDVTLVARGAHLAAMRVHGVRIISSQEEIVAFPHCTDDLSAVADADFVLLTVKAHSLPQLAPRIGPLLAPKAAVVSAQNGLPWWYFSKHGGPLDGTRLRTADPDDTVSDSIGVERVIGCIVYPATRLVEPGVIEHVEGNRFSIGELDGTRSERCQALSAMLTRAGLKCPVRTRIRHELWLKLLGNAVLNPISALTRATLEDITRDGHTRSVAAAAMREADSVARAVGVDLEISVEQRLEGASQVGAHKTSMLQDLESGRPLEVDAVLGAVVEIGDLLGLDLPHLRTLYACTTLLASVGATSCRNDNRSSTVAAARIGDVGPGNSR